MDQMNVNRGMWPSDGPTATGGPTAAAAPPRPYAQPAMQPTAQQLVFTLVAGAAAAAEGAENTNMTEGTNVGETRGREASPPRPSTPPARLAVRVWESKWLRELTVEEGTVHAELDGDEIRTLMKIDEDAVYPPAAFMDEAAKHCRASSGLRSAAIAKWSHKAFHTLVMVRAVTDLVWPARQSIDMQQVELLRDAVMEVFPWAFNVVFEDDYEWPERGQTQTAASKRDVVVRVVWVELVLRLGVAARRGTERLVQRLLPQPPEDGAEAAVRVMIVEPETENARRDLGADVAREYGKGREAAATINTEVDTAELRRRKRYKPLAVRRTKRMRNDVAADENHNQPELVHLRANAISDVRRRNVMVVDDRDAKAATEEIVALSSRTKLPALHGTPRSPAELVMCEANVGEEIVRHIFDAVDLVAKQPYVGAVKDFAVKIMAAIDADAEGAAGTSHETFNTIVATLSPLAKDFTKADNQFSVEMAKQLAWIRSMDAAGMMPLLNERMAECAARVVPGTVARDDDMASPACACGRTDAATAAAHTVIGEVAAGVPRLPRVNEGAEMAATEPVEHGGGAATAPAPAATATNGALPTAQRARLLQLGAPTAATETAAPGLPPAPPTAMLPLYNPIAQPIRRAGTWDAEHDAAGNGCAGWQPDDDAACTGDDAACAGDDDAACAGDDAAWAAWVRSGQHRHADGTGDASTDGRYESAAVWRDTR